MNIATAVGEDLSKCVGLCFVLMEKNNFTQLWLFLSCHSYLTIGNEMSVLPLTLLSLTGGILKISDGPLFPLRVLILDFWWVSSLATWHLPTGHWITVAKKLLYTPAELYIILVYNKCPQISLSLIIFHLHIFSFLCLLWEIDLETSNLFVFTYEN